MPVFIALGSWAVAIACAWKVYSSIRTGHMSVGTLPAFNFTREQRPTFFWWFAGMFALISALMIYNGFGALLSA
jgi:hypothetical protein